MIRTEREYGTAKHELLQSQKRAEAYRASLEREGLAPEVIKRLVDPMISFDCDLADEIKEYESWRCGEVPALSLGSIGRFLTGLRIAKGWTQRELARALGVHESTVSKDENNEYHGITIDRAQRIVEVLDMPAAIVLAADYQYLLEQARRLNELVSTMQGIDPSSAPLSSSTTGGDTRSPNHQGYWSVDS